MKQPDLKYKVITCGFDMDNQISAIAVRAFSRAILIDYEQAMLGILKFAETEEYHINNDVPIKARCESVTLGTKLYKQFKLSGAIHVINEASRLVFGEGQKGYLVMIVFSIYNLDHLLFSVSGENIPSEKNLEYETLIYQKYNYEYGIHKPINAYSENLKRNITAIPF